jgi:hypothetical protein
MDLTQEIIGTIGATLAAKLVGFETTKVIPKMTGIDMVLWDRLLDRYVIMEAKGGSSGLSGATATNPAQMSKCWIDINYQRAIQVCNDPNEKARLLVEQDQPKWAVVVKLNLGSKTAKPRFTFEFQTYPSIGTWGRSLNAGQ